MGMNLLLHRLRAERVPNEIWDTIRHSGDRAIAETSDIKRKSIVFGECIYWRPEDFKEARKFVSDSLEPLGNKQRLFEVLERMECDDSLWFENSY